MNKKFILTLLSSPTIFASFISLVALVNPVSAAETQVQTQGDKNCVMNPHGGYKLICTRVSQVPKVKRPITVAKADPVQSVTDDIIEIKFTDEESDSAIALFGCDCPSCLNALRAMRGQEPIIF
ncbi:hypothetical protein [Mastigocoleus testarum]|uniref:Uncharacterized protein n=1 Tax=Mastigocoleus testarum BC008 TaxID=371196 RepID=A0A0V7ZRZ8_9CYAN|nr:hypothetical protein [Mastigocoleus testarum]KST67389.1 hypothetical protein BC008_29795 [Mastigocoleus testarum BC008]